MYLGPLRHETTKNMSRSTKKKHICFVITAQNQYARSVEVLKELKREKGARLSIVVGGSALLPQYGDVPRLLKEDGFASAADVELVVEGSTPSAMAKSTGLGTIEFTSVFTRLEPDVVVVRGDRYEMLAAAIAASYLNIPLAHIEGGDVSGTIDESVRHAITKLAHLHFVTNKDSERRVVRMGEPKKYVVNVGAPEVEIAEKAKKRVSTHVVNEHGVGEVVDLTKPYLVVMNHPVTNEYGENREHTRELLEAVDRVGVPTVWFWPNIDAGSDEVSKAIRIFREEGAKKTSMRFLKYLAPEDFLALLRNASALVGNSSAGIKEASYFGTPVVNIGTRQEGRLRAKNVVDVKKYQKGAMVKAIESQLAHGSYAPSSLYYKKGTSKRIVDTLLRVHPEVQKRFVD